MRPHKYRIVVSGDINDDVAGGIADITQRPDDNGLAVLEGDFIDQSHLDGLLSQLRGLGLEISDCSTMSAAEALAATYNTAATMQAIGVTAKPPVSEVPDQLKMLAVPIPRPQADEVAIKLGASSMHIDEIYAAQGTALGRFYGPKNVSEDNPYILGSSVSGTVVARGENANAFDIGAPVIVIPNEKGESGSWATYRCVAESMVIAKPVELSHVEAAAVTMAACVGLGVVERSQVRAGARCVVVGASGSVGSMVMQFLKVRGCHVTAVSSGASEEFVRAHGADEVIDYNLHQFGRFLTDHGKRPDAVFDCVGGRDIEANAFEALKPDGVFATVVGPQQYIGERKLGWWEVSKVLGYIARRMLMTRFAGPRYIFGEKLPREIIAEAIDQVTQHNIRMPVQDVIDFELDLIVNAVQLLSTHRAKGRIVIDFTKHRAEPEALSSETKSTTSANLLPVTISTATEPET